MRTLALGDVHGCYRALTTLVERAPIHTSDLVVTLGDYVDRGPDSRAVLDWLIGRAAADRLVSLRGNHELMMLLARDEPACLDAWLDMGGDETLHSYRAAGVRGGDDSPLDGVPETHWWFIEQYCRDYYENDTHIFVHASASPELEMSQQSEHMLFWQKFHRPPEPHASGKILVCGHTPQKSGVPLDIGHAICIDTWAYGGGWLTCFEPATRKYWQANEAGDFRSGALP